MTARILVAEDDVKQAELLRLYLEREGYSVAVVHDGLAALEQARQKRPDLVLLDIMMPKADGLDVCRILRADDSDVPIVMLTARSTEDDMVLGLDLGADDYLTKPISPRALVARVRTVLRRTGALTGGREKAIVYRHGDLEVDTGRHEVRMAGRLIDVTRTEFGVLEVLVAIPGTVCSRRELLDSALGFDHYALPRTVDMHVMNLRRKLEDDPRQPRYLQTVYGVGYKLVEHPPDGP